MTAPGAREAVFGGPAGGSVPVGLLTAGAAGIGDGAATSAKEDDAVTGAKKWPEAACALRGRPESVKLARDFARETLTAWGLPDLCDDVTWVISELITNALHHGLPHSPRTGWPCTGWARPIPLSLAMQPAHVLCMVSDPGAGAPVLPEPDHLRECGRGLQVVDSCSDRWAGARWTVGKGNLGRVPHPPLRVLK